MGSSKWILVVDDDAHVCAYLADLIRYFGFNVEHVNSCKGAMRRIQEKHFDSLVLDHCLEDGSVHGLLGWLRGGGREMPVVVMSALANYDLWIELMNKGVADLIPKPVQPGQLKRALQLAMGEQFFAERVHQPSVGH